MKHKKWLKISIIIVCLLLVIGTTTSATNVNGQGHWAENNIKSLADEGFIEEDAFVPEDAITWAEFAALTGQEIKIDANVDGNVLRASACAAIGKALNMTPDSEFAEKFKDSGSIDSSDLPFVGAMVNAGIISGYPDGTFKPEKALTNAEAAVIVSLAKAYARTSILNKFTFDSSAVVSRVESGEGDDIAFDMDTINGDGVLRVDYSHTGSWETLKLHMPTSGEYGSLYKDSTHVMYDLIFPKEAVEESSNTQGYFWTVIAHPNNGWWKDYGKGQTYGISDMQPYGDDYYKLTVKTYIEESTRGESKYTGGDFYIQPTVDKFTNNGVFFIDNITFYTVKVPLNEIIINETDVSLAVTGTVKLTAKLRPDTAFNKSITWTSSDPSKVSVSEDGLVTGIDIADSVTVTAAANDGSGVTAECKVQVVGLIAPASVTLDKSDITLAAGWGETELLTAIVGDDNATDKTVTWTSSDTNIAKVRNGVVTAIAEGTAIIKATANGDESGRIYAECKVNITPAPSNDSSGEKRIKAQGTKLVVGPANKEIFINGANTPWNKWDDFGNGFNETWWDDHFKSLRDNGVNATRIWILCSGDKGIRFDSEGFVTGMSDEFWADLGKLFDIAEKYEIYIMATTASFDCFISDKANFEKWQAMIRDSDKIDSYVENYLIPLVNRFGSNEYLWSVDFCNEIDWVYEREDCNNVPWENISEFFARSAVGIHKNSDVLVTAGMAMTKYNTDADFPNDFSASYEGNKISDEVLQSYFDDEESKALAYVDFYSSHYYEWECPWFGNPFMYSPAEYGLVGKPSLIGETAAVGSGWSYMYADESTGWQSKPKEDAKIQTLLDDYENAIAKGYSGVMPWTSNGVDACGGFDDLIKATKPIAEKYPNLVYPLK